MTKRILLEKQGQYYRLIAAHFNNENLDKVEEIVEGKILKEVKGLLFELLPDWKSIRIER